MQTEQTKNPNYPHIVEETRQLPVAMFSLDDELTFFKKSTKKTFRVLAVNEDKDPPKLTSTTKSHDS